MSDALEAGEFGSAALPFPGLFRAATVRPARGWCLCLAICSFREIIDRRTRERGATVPAVAHLRPGSSLSPSQPGVPQMAADDKPVTRPIRTLPKLADLRGFFRWLFTGRLS